VPFRSHFAGGTTERIAFRNLWFQMKNESNVIWVCGANHADYPGDGILGLALASQNYCYVCVGAIEGRQEPGADPVLANADTTVHEIGHQFGLSDHAGEGHQNHEDSDRCVMHDDTNIDDDACEFCVGCLGAVRSLADGL